MEYLSTLFNIAEVAFGIGLVIFLHELGHFALAKWNGVKVEKFSIGFGKTIIGFTRGETEYVLAVIPLGGFVKMLGEGPDEEANKSSDPRAYPNKSVGARMAIISAGVIMNLILGMACFVYTYGKGRDETSTRIGAVMAGSLAYEAGIKAGDEIVAIDGRRDRGFDNVLLKIRLSSQGQVLHLELKRPGQDAPIHIDIEPKRNSNADHPSIGITSCQSLEIAKPPFVIPAGSAETPNAADPGLKTFDKVVAVGVAGEEATPVEDIQTLYKLLTKKQDQPLNFVIERRKHDDDGNPVGEAEKVTVVLQPNRFVDFGFRLQIRPLAAVLKGSIADKAGFKKGDLLLKVNGNAEFDPMRLPSIVYQNAGKPMTFEVRREDADPKAPPVILTATPDDTPPWVEGPIEFEPVDVCGLGIAYQVRTKVEGVLPNSPAAKAGIKTGDMISSLTLPGIERKGVISKPLQLLFDDETPNWPLTFQLLQYRKYPAIEMTINGSSDPVKIKAEVVNDWYNPVRGEQFMTLVRKGKPLDAWSALSRGFEDTVDNVLSIYAMLRSLAQGRVSPKGLGGPILIAHEAYARAASSQTDLVHFLGFLSINLAVINFLPIPPLDGGQMVFLIAEKIRGRPLPDSALIAGTYVGLILVLSLMVFVLFQDVTRYFTFFS